MSSYSQLDGCVRSLISVLLTFRGLVTHIYVSNTCDRWFWSRLGAGDKLLSEPMLAYFSGDLEQTLVNIWSKWYNFLTRKSMLIQWRPFCLGINAFRCRHSFMSSGISRGCLIMPVCWDACTLSMCKDRTPPFLNYFKYTYALLVVSLTACIC